MMKFYYYKTKPKDHPFPIVAWLIMLFQGMNPFNKNSSSHRALGYVCPDGHTKVIDSTGKYGVSVHSIYDFTKKHKIVEETYFKLDLSCYDVNEWVISILGRKYDKLQIFGLLIKRVFGFITFNSLGKNYRALTCNEVILNFIEEFKVVKQIIVDSDNWDLIMTDKLIDNIT